MGLAPATPTRRDRPGIWNPGRGVVDAETVLLMACAGLDSRSVRADRPMILDLPRDRRTRSLAERIMFDGTFAV